jgi:hypothetical protein
MKCFTFMFYVAAWHNAKLAELCAIGVGKETVPPKRHSLAQAEQQTCSEYLFAGGRGPTRYKLGTV